MSSGLVQLEALESLSGSSEQKVRRFVDMLPKDAAESLKSELMQIRQVFDGVHADCDDGQWVRLCRVDDSDVNKTKFLRPRPKLQDQDRCLQDQDQDQDHRK